ncbi:MAG: hypothetical protein JWQ71_1923 [Pedosphaera sp.]|nr:hypothetical protein [Pedosphaera sp.]
MTGYSTWSRANIIPVAVGRLALRSLMQVPAIVHMQERGIPEATSVAYYLCIKENYQPSQLNLLWAVHKRLLFRESAP